MHNEAVKQVPGETLRPWAALFTHGDLQVDHVFVDDDDVTGVIGWSEAGQGDPAYDRATLTIGHSERVADVISGYSGDVDFELLRA